MRDSVSVRPHYVSVILEQLYLLFTKYPVRVGNPCWRQINSKGSVANQKAYFSLTFKSEVGNAGTQAVYILHLYHAEASRSG